MGGLAFSKGPNALNTPRMSPFVYQHVREKCHAALRELFVVVATPIEGPGKTDYGDIDIFVTWKKDEYFGSFPGNTISGADQKYPFDAIKQLLGAKRIIQEQPSAAMLAIPWPQSLPIAIEDPMKETADGPRFIQVDVHICPSLENLEWFIFKHAHGDLWNLLGSTIRPYGLTVDEVGLYIRIPEIEKLDRKKARVLLTEDPCQVLTFLGLEYTGQEWEEKFGSMEDVFEYAATTRFFWVRPASSEVDSTISDGEECIGGEFTKKKLKSNDRRRMGQRPLFRRWIEEFLPKCREQGRANHQHLSRDETREEAFQQFGVRDVYHARLIDFQKERQRQTLWKDVIKAAIPPNLDPHWRSVAASALKKIIMQDDDSFDGYRPQVHIRDDDGMYIEDEVRRFVQDSWEAVGKIAWEQNQLRFKEKMAMQTVKGTKRTASGGEKGSQSLDHEEAQ
ncbi:uncharacterized protein JN550_011496 [Neoarthrinium moseri]|uniref:uncharacterized protein n=1 Tax=Neoarthrinium moseri TaxID=1658444 RepID=UPI001FDDD909|nr:uncharacterized protein JN550_011496 [Neoarthrinium moseri]KAI1860648.1 hypothetical protein JN550_011496 [Neoarthrinium moseri]